MTRDAKAVDYKIIMHSNRNTYGGRFKGWSANEDHHYICVPTDWRVRVQRRGLAVAGGMFTLDLQPLVGHGAIELFQAVWVAQSRGYGVTIHFGVVARLGDEVFHAQDAQHAIRGVTLKARNSASPARQRLSGYELSVDAFIARYRQYGGIDVGIDDAQAIGACEYGIQSWCHAVGIDQALGYVSLSRVLEGFRTQPLIEVRRTVLQAIKLHRAHARL